MFFVLSITRFGGQILLWLYYSRQFLWNRLMGRDWINLQSVFILICVSTHITSVFLLESWICILLILYIVMVSWPPFHFIFLTLSLMLKVFFKIVFIIHLHINVYSLICMCICMFAFPLSIKLLIYSSNRVVILYFFT